MNVFGCTVARHRPDAIRRRLHDAFLDRFSRHEFAESYALRGGVRFASLLPDAQRRAQDIDLVALHPLDIERHVRTALYGTQNQVKFECLAAIPTADAGRPLGVRMHIAGETGGRRATFTVDVNALVSLWPHPVARRGIRNVAASTMVGTKLKVLAELGPYRWRAKDLRDALLLLRHGAIPRRELAEATECAWEQGSPLVDSPAALLRSAEWWRGPHGVRCWADLRKETGAPPLCEAVDELRIRLRQLAS
ncbi:MAG: nucleotidyl transferase AbiEii/AbiGii toxin family protein [Myxococcota bacterium]